mgnify:CR=1 FL=1
MHLLGRLRTHELRRALWTQEIHQLACCLLCNYPAMHQLDGLRYDFTLIHENCKAFNEPTAVIVKDAKKVQQEVVTPAPPRPTRPSQGEYAIGTPDADEQPRRV